MKRMIMKRGRDKAAALAGINTTEIAEKCTGHKWYIDVVYNLYEGTLFLFAFFWRAVRKSL